MKEIQRTSLKLLLDPHLEVAADLTLNTGSTPTAVIVFLHGYKGFKDWGCWNAMADRFAEANLAVLKFNFSGNGTTHDAPTDFADLDAFAKNTYSQEVREAVAVIEQVEQGVIHPAGLPKGLPIHVIGHSRGGAIAILAAASSKTVAKVTTWAAVSDFGRRFVSGEFLEEWREKGVMYVANARTGQQLPHHYTWYTDYQSNAERLDIRAAARKLTQPLLVIHAANDEAVQVGEGKELFAAASSASLIVLHDGGHTFGSKHPWGDGALPEPLREAIDQTISFLSA